MSAAACAARGCPAGLRGMAAVKRSRALLRRLRWQLAVPFVGLVVAGRLLEGAKATLLSSMPPRWVPGAMVGAVLGHEGACWGPDHITSSTPLGWLAFGLSGSYCGMQRVHRRACRSPRRVASLCPALPDFLSAFRCAGGA